jgi:serine O-acetyltransferase
MTGPLLRRSFGVPAFDFESAAIVQAAVTPLVISKAGPTDLTAYGTQIWESVRSDAEKLGSSNALLKRYLAKAILSHSSLTDSLAHILADRLSDHGIERADLAALLAEELAEEKVMRATLADLLQVVTIDPCLPELITVLLHFKGFHALQAHRAAHALWKRGDAPSRQLALMLQGRVSATCGLDIHPQATIGHGVFFDHATGGVIGQTASIGDFCYILHGITLGSTGKTVGGRRHPRIGSHVSLGAGSAILGPVTVGDHALIGAHAIVTKTVSNGATVVGTNKVLDKAEAITDEFDWLSHWHI